jgi:hypothetical protein
LPVIRKLEPMFSDIARQINFRLRQLIARWEYTGQIRPPLLAQADNDDTEEAGNFHFRALLKRAQGQSLQSTDQGLAALRALLLGESNR